MSHLRGFRLQGHNVLSISRVIIVPPLLINEVGDAIVLLLRLGGATVAD